MKISIFAMALLLTATTHAKAQAPAPNGYGINVHFNAGKHTNETANAENICQRLARDGFGTIRVGFSWAAAQSKPGGAYDFTQFDRIFNLATTNNIELLPLLKGAPGWARPVWQHLDAWQNYVRAFTERYQNRITSIEIWNEENTKGFWKNPRQTGTREDPYVDDYIDLLKTSYETIKAVNPKIKVAIGGFSSVPMPYIRKLYKTGGNRYFDVMNVHPYSRPLAPEGSFDTRLEELRALMNANGDASKPIRVSEVGWPTHRIKAEHPELLAEGLNKAKPEKTTWRIAYAQFEQGVDDPDGSMIAGLNRELPAGSEIVPLEEDALIKAIGNNEYDAVLMPLIPDFRSEAIGEIEEFVKRGGVLIWFGKRFSRPGKRNVEGFIVGDTTFDLSAFRKFFRFAQNDHKQEFGAAVLQPSGLKEGDTFEPLKEVKDKNGKTLVTAAVIRYASDLKGAIVISGYDESPGGTSEALQARYLVRMMAMAAALGITNVEYYDLVAPERTPYDSENNYGVWHNDFSPKPAYAAYCEYIRKRPAGSVNRDDIEWKSKDGIWFSPQWKRPDGTAAGLIWKRGRATEREMELGEGVKFFDLFGKPLSSAKGTTNGRYRITASESPIYWQAK